MPSHLTWIDYDSAQRDRVRRILSMVNERDTRDELGLGGIRDSISDQLFPGTSTIQTRLRYFLFVPWMYQELERQRVPPARIANEGRRYELRLRDALMAAGDPSGVFGREAARALKRLASSVYWAGLGTWGIRRFRGSRDEYFSSLASLYRRRRGEGQREDGFGHASVSEQTWHPELPDPPPGLPDEASLRLRRIECEFLQDCISNRHGDSLLALLVRNAHEVIPNVDRPWEHPSLADFALHHRALLSHGRMFSSVMYGASILYNLLLARHGQREALIEEHARGLQNWRESVDLNEVRSWSIDDLWRMTLDRGHSITSRTQRFVHAWVERLNSTNGAIADDRAAGDLVRQREYALKGSRSRFRNPRAFDQFGGRAGLNPMQYRWSEVRVLLADLHDGLVGD